MYQNAKIFYVYIFTDKTCPNTQSFAEIRYVDYKSSAMAKVTG